MPDRVEMNLLVVRELCRKPSLVSLAVLTAMWSGWTETSPRSSMRESLNLRRRAEAELEGLTQGGSCTQIIRRRALESFRRLGVAVCRRPTGLPVISYTAHCIMLSCALSTSEASLMWPRVSEDLQSGW